MEELDSDYKEIDKNYSDRWLFYLSDAIQNTLVPGKMYMIRLYFEEDSGFSMGVKSELGPIENSYTLILTSGFLRYHFDMLYLYLSDNAIFPGIGTSDKKVNCPPISINDYSRLENYMYGVELPKFDEYRREIHHFLFDMSIKLILWHECVHITRGHVGYSEDLSSNHVILSKLDRQTLEMDADCMAIFYFHDELMKEYNTRALRLPQELYNEEFLRKCLTFVSFFVCFLSSPIKIKSIIEQQDRDYPCGTLRYNNQMSMIGNSYLISRMNSQFSDIVKCYFAVLRYFLDYYQYDENMRSAINMEIEIFTRSDEGVVYQKKLFTNFSRIKEKLVPFSIAADYDLYASFIE